MDLGGGRRGVDMGPSAFRIAGIEGAVRGLGHGFRDLGNVRVDEPDLAQPVDPTARFLTEIAECCVRLHDRVRAVMDEGWMPLVVGGDHSIAVGTVGGISTHFHAKGEKVGLVWFDAHGDMNTPDTTESGNIHGMPLAACLGHGPDALTKLGDRFPLLDVKNAAIVGVRSLDDQERALIREVGVRCYTMKEIDERGIHAVTREAIKIASDGTAGFHMSFDVDGCDPEVAPGVGTPVPGGINYREAHTVLEMAAESGKLIGLEMTEINPILDNRNRTARVAVEFCESALGRRIL
jgi:arginase